MTARRALAAAAVLLLILGAGTWLVWVRSVRPGLLADKGRNLHMRRLAQAVVSFNTAQGRLPKSLEEMVRTGALPEESEACFSPIAAGGLKARKVSYRNCGFELSFAKEAVTVSWPASVRADPRYARVAAEAFVVTPGLTLVPGS